MFNKGLTIKYRAYQKSDLDLTVNKSKCKWDKCMNTLSVKITSSCEILKIIDVNGYHLSLLEK